MTYTAAALIAAHAERGHTITADTAALYLAQAVAADAQFQQVLAGGNWDRAADRPYAEQYLCNCGRDFAIWAIEALVDGKADRILHCPACAGRNSDETYVQLFTPQQVAVWAALDAQGIGR